MAFRLPRQPIARGDSTDVPDPFDDPAVLADPAAGSTPGSTVDVTYDASP